MQIRLVRTGIITDQMGKKAGFTLMAVINQNRFIHMTDWRLRGQERYLKGVKLDKSSYSPYRENWDHDHCEFCNATFSLKIEGSETEGWSTENRYHWVCNECYNDFKILFDW